MSLSIAPEEKVLKQRDSKVVNDNDWEEFTLNNVKIFPLATDSNHLVSLLNAYEAAPVRVIGQLSPVDKDQEHLVLDPDYYSKSVVLRRVTHFAYGELDNGAITVWAAGKAGWYYLKPAQEYMEVYNGMLEAIHILYFFADRQRKKRTLKKSIDGGKYMWRKFIEEGNTDCREISDVLEKFKLHRIFLLTQMLSGKEGIDWQNTALYSELKEKYPADFEKVASTLKAKNNLRVVNDPDVMPVISASKSPTPPAITESSYPTIVKGRLAQAEVIYDFIESAAADGPISTASFNIEKVSGLLGQRYDFHNSSKALDRIKKLSREIVQLMDKSDAKSEGYGWSNRFIYNQLATEAASQDFSDTPHPMQLRSGKIEQVEMDEEEPSAKRRRISSIRPASSLQPRTGGKAPKRSRSSFISNSDDFNYLNESTDPSGDDEYEKMHIDEDKPIDFTTDFTRELRSTSASTRTHPYPHAGFLHESPEVISISSSPHLDDDPSPPSPPKKTIPMGTLTVVSAPIPTNQPNRPGNVWACPIDGCITKFYNASSDDSQDRIRNHYRKHAQQTKAQILMMQEIADLNLPTAQIWSKIKSIAESVPEEYRDFTSEELEQLNGLAIAEQQGSKTAAQRIAKNALDETPRRAAPGGGAQINTNSTLASFVDMKPSLPYHNPIKKSRWLSG
ncbi:MAG: hypothetical protein M1834_001027 [Cirrosporium novae-zelandiae]|nr:MAG: hypothetical protein M1834_001027 [Cirrosporium novae-zelandiae]